MGGGISSNPSPSDAKHIDPRLWNWTRATGPKLQGPGQKGLVKNLEADLIPSPAVTTKQNREDSLDDVDDLLKPAVTCTPVKHVSDIVHNIVCVLSTMVFGCFWLCKSTFHAAPLGLGIILQIEYHHTRLDVPKLFPSSSLHLCFLFSIF